MRPTFVLPAACALLTGCAWLNVQTQPEVTQSSPDMVTVRGSPVTGSGNEQVYALAQTECRKQGRRAAVLHKAETAQLNPVWRFHCVN